MFTHQRLPNPSDSQMSNQGLRLNLVMANTSRYNYQLYPSLPTTSHDMKRCLFWGRASNRGRQGALMVRSARERRLLLYMCLYLIAFRILFVDSIMYHTKSILPRQLLPGYMKTWLVTIRDELKGCVSESHNVVDEIVGGGVAIRWVKTW